MSNPLLDNPLDALPDFDAVQAQHFYSALSQLVDDSKKVADDIAENNNLPSWGNLLLPIEESNDRLERAWSIVSHLNGVMNNDAVRAAHDESLAVITSFSTYMGQHKPLFNACQALKNSRQYSALSDDQKKDLDNRLRDFTLAGIDLSQTKQKRYKDIKKRLAELGSQFSNNVLDATQSWSKHLLDAGDLSGLPESSLLAAKNNAEKRNLDGYLVTLDLPSYLPVMQYCENRQLREELYTAYVSRASDTGPGDGQWDNSSVMDEILQLRRELARLLGFENYAELSMAKKMASTAEEAEHLLSQLAQASVDIAKREFLSLVNFAQKSLGIDTLEAWDIPFATEALRLDRYRLSQEELRPYFPVGAVIEGMFNIVERLYGIEIRAGDAPSRWHEDVLFFEIFQGENIIAQFYLDLFAREGKRSGAWMSDCSSRRKTMAGTMQRPVAFLTCNFSAPADDKPSLLTHDEVTTLFHEFGHGLHHMLTTVDCPGVSGINGVAWDAVELPSQFMENWCWEKEALPLISSHYQTGEKLPAELLDKMLAARNFQAAMQMVRQLEFALFDLKIHREYGTEEWQDIQSALDSVRSRVSVYQVPACNRFQHGFSHIFAGGYAAGYYSYKWAEVLSADAYSLFEKNGIFDKATGQKFLTEILQKGGSEDASILFKNFRGREPSIDALLRHNGISP